MDGINCSVKTSPCMKEWMVADFSKGANMVKKKKMNVRLPLLSSNITTPYFKYGQVQVVL